MNEEGGGLFLSYFLCFHLIIKWKKLGYFLWWTIQLCFWFVCVFYLFMFGFAVFFFRVKFDNNKLLFKCCKCRKHILYTRGLKNCAEMEWINYIQLCKIIYHLIWEYYELPLLSYFINSTASNINIKSNAIK